MTQPAPPEGIEPIGLSGSESCRCPVCRAPSEGEMVQCPHCRMPHHKECWDYNGGCGSYGCTSAPATEKLSEIEIPPAFWGQSEKTCPACGASIQAAALRCRACGTVFPTAKPQNAAEFRHSKELVDDAPKLRRQSIILLVLSIIPFTAPLGAIAATIWYTSKHHRLMELPAQQRAIGKIAVAVGWGQTLILFAVTALYGLFGRS